MKCSYCQYEDSESFAFCPSCGAPAEASAPTAEAPRRNRVAERLLPALKSEKFLAICVLLSASVGTSLFVGGIALLTLLAMIFAWQAYAAARKNILNAKHLRGISGTVYANYILNNIGAICSIIGGVMMAGLFLGMEELTAETINEMLAFYPAELIGIATFILTFPAIVGVLFALFGVAMLLFNLFILRSLHKFTKSTYESLSTGEPEDIQKKNCVFVLLWLLGIGFGISTILSVPSMMFLSALSTGCLSAACILAAYLVRDTFAEKNEI